MENSTVYILDIAKKNAGIESDYGLSKALGVSRTRVSNWRTGRAHISPSDEIIIKLSELCDIPVDKLSLLLLSNRTTSPELRKIFERAAGTLSRVATYSFVALSPFFDQMSAQLCILCKIAKPTKSPQIRL